ncbi:MAG: sigma 54-interacting transcriptional regulator [Planctomycetota bacterium]
MDRSELFSRALGALAERDCEGALRATLEAMVALTGADRGFVVLAGDGEGEVLARAGAALEPYGRGPSQAVLAKVLAEGRAVRLENALESDEFGARPSVVGLSVLSILAVPIVGVGDGEALAAVYLDSVRVAGIFGPEAEQLAVELAAAVAPGIQARLELREVERRLAVLEEAPGPLLLGRAPCFLAAVERARRAAASEVPLLITGESGVGKDVLARAVHAWSGRASGPFVPVNCGAIPEGMLESELFGHTKGAFTGADRERSGRIEAAAGGTLFLDEVGELPLALQVKLLRFLQSGEVQKLGESRERHVSVRVVAATNASLEERVREGRFREDLLYRLRVVAVEVPPLRERGDDVLLLAEAFARRLGREHGTQLAGLGGPAREALLRHPFPGNVRELENALLHAAVFAQGPRVALADLPPELAQGPGARARGALTPGPVPRDLEELKQAREEASARVERAFLDALLERAGGNVSRAARLANMNRAVLHELMSRHGVSAEPYRR